MRPSAITSLSLVSRETIWPEFSRAERAKSARTIEASEAGEDAWVKQCIAKARNVGDFFENCTPGYYNNEGKSSELSVQNGFYGGGSIEFFGILAGWRADGKLEGLELR